MQDPKKTTPEDNDSLSDFEKLLNDALEQSTEEKSEDQE